MAAKQYAYCPGCDTRIRFSKRPNMGHKITCPECSESLEVVEVSPVELDWAYSDYMTNDSHHDEFTSYDWEDNW